MALRDASSPGLTGEDSSGWNGRLVVAIHDRLTGFPDLSTSIDELCLRAWRCRHGADGAFALPGRPGGADRYRPIGGRDRNPLRGRLGGPGAGVDPDVIYPDRRQHVTHGAFVEPHPGLAGSQRQQQRRLGREGEADPLPRRQPACAQGQCAGRALVNRYE
jgi:hypothetical protein